MTAKEFLDEHGIPNMPTQYSPQFQTDVNDTEKALEAYHQAKLKLLGIANVVGQSEQFCECDGVQDLIAGTGECRKCGGQCTY